MSNCFLADNNEVPWAVIGDRFDTDTVTAQALSSRQARRSRGGDFHWPHVGTSRGHQRGLSHGHGHKTIAAYEASVDAYVAGSPTEVADPVGVLLDEVVAHVPDGEVLEIGSGPGGEAQYLEHRGLRVHRTDATPAFVERLRQSGHQARVLDVRCDGLGGPFDAVLANAVLLHLHRDDLHRAFRACHAATRTGGVFALTLKEGDGEAWSDAMLGQPRWFVYWREPALRQALHDASWTVLWLAHVQGRLDRWLHVLCRRDDS